MSRTNDELAAEARRLLKDPSIDIALSPFLMAAAQRLEARGEISEGAVERAASIPDETP